MIHDRIFPVTAYARLDGMKLQINGTAIKDKGESVVITLDSVLVYDSILFGEIREPKEPLNILDNLTPALVKKYEDELIDEAKAILEEDQAEQDRHDTRWH